MGGSCNNKKSKGVGYSEEFQALLDRLEEEDSYEYEDEEEEDDEEEGGVKDGRRRRRRKLTTDQVRALEAMFEAERRLGPARKAAIAAELGMEPRQVAVWFQNRRARCKTKQLEREFSCLQACYDALRRDYDSLDKATKSLLAEVKDLEAKVKARNIGFGGEQMGSYVSMAQATTLVAPEMMVSLMDVDYSSPPLLQPLQPRDDAYIVDQQSGFFVNGPGEGGVTSSTSTWDVFSFDQSTFF